MSTDSIAQRSIEILEPGLETTVQDTGRPGHLAIGLPPSGAQDNWALRIANLLVGNPTGVPPLSLGDPGAAGLEFVLRGPKLRFHGDATIAITGGAFRPKVDAAPVPTWEAITVADGSVLDLGIARKGLRGYLAFGGGIEVPRYVGSRSTYARGRLGGHEGRVLEPDDRLALEQAAAAGRAGLRLREELVPQYSGCAQLRVVRGPQEHLFTSSAVEDFYATEWLLTPVADRMGFRFRGPDLETLPRSAEVERDAGSGATNVVADVTPLGGLQVPGHGELIAIGVDVPSVGGYAKIATIVSADIGRLGQLRPGGRARFVPVELSEAIAIGRECSALVAETSLRSAT